MSDKNLRSFDIRPVVSQNQFVHSGIAKEDRGMPGRPGRHLPRGGSSTINKKSLDQCLCQIKRKTLTKIWKYNCKLWTKQCFADVKILQLSPPDPPTGALPLDPVL